MQACNVDTYHGGLMCCKHSWFLTDRDQDQLIPKDQVDTYYLKWRYYFQEYKPASNRSPASHKHLHHWVFLIDAQGSQLWDLRDHPLSTYANFSAFLTPSPPLYAFWAKS